MPLTRANKVNEVSRFEIFFKFLHSISAVYKEFFKNGFSNFFFTTAVVAFNRNVTVKRKMLCFDYFSIVCVKSFYGLNFYDFVQNDEIADLNQRKGNNLIRNKNAATTRGRHALGEVSNNLVKGDAEGGNRTE